MLVCYVEKLGYETIINGITIDKFVFGLRFN